MGSWSATWRVGDSDTPEAARAALRGAGLRVTAPRTAVLVWLSGHPHATADQIQTAVAGTLGSVSTQAVYDVLAACVGARLLRRIEPAGHPARFECRVGDNHHHVVCRVCGRTEDTDCATGARPCLAPADDHGFALDEAEVVFWGLCPRCRHPDNASAAKQNKPVQNQVTHYPAGQG